MSTTSPARTSPARTSPARTADARPSRPGSALRRHTAAVVSVAAAVALLVAAGCTSTASAQGQEPAAATTLAGAQVTFGTPYEYGNGLFLQVKSPLTFAPTDQAEGVDEAAGQPVRIRFTITNGTRQEFTPHTLSATVVSGGQESTQIIDPGLQIDLTGPGATLRPAGVISFDLAFVVADTSDVTLTVVPALGGYEPLVLTTD